VIQLGRIRLMGDSDCPFALPSPVGLLSGRHKRPKNNRQQDYRPQGRIPVK